MKPVKDSSQRHSYKRWERLSYHLVIAGIGILLLLRGSIYLGYAWTEMGFLRLNHQFAQGASIPLKNTEAVFRRAVASSSQPNGLAWWGLGVTLAWNRSDEPAKLAFQQSNAKSIDLVFIGDKLRQHQEEAAALYWYAYVTEIDPMIVDSWYQMGQIYEAQGRWEQARQAYEVVWQLEPAFGAHALAAVYGHLGDFPAAERVLGEALSKFPDAAERVLWWLTLGAGQEQQGKWEEAVSVYEMAAAEFPANFALLTQLGWAYYERGDGIEKAISVLEEAIALDETRGGGYFIVAQLLAQEQRYEEADDWFQLALERDSNQFWQLSRANTARQANNLHVAVAIYQALIKMDPLYAPAFYEAAWAYYLNDQLTEAIFSIERGIELMDSPPAVYYVRAGQIYEAAGDFEAALGAYGKAVSLAPHNQQAVEGMNRLEAK